MAEPVRLAGGNLVAGHMYVPPDSISIHPELNVFKFTISPRALSVDYPEWDLIRELGRSCLVLMSVE